ncbi:MAG: hypothetical protein AAGN66_04220 [Acidobacteriota bacterium]
MVFEGWNTSGKGAVIRKLTEPLEPRGFELVWVREPRSHHQPLPWLWRFWRTLPPYGAMAIYDHSWYWRTLVELQDSGEGLTRREPWLERLRDITRFEQLLTDSRYEIIKFFLHIGEDEQRRRLEALARDDDAEPRAGSSGRHDRYGRDYLLVEEILERTESAAAPWSIVPATDLRFARHEVCRLVARRFEEALERRGFEVPEPLGDDVSLDSCDDGRNGEGGSGEGPDPAAAEEG